MVSIILSSELILHLLFIPYSKGSCLSISLWIFGSVTALTAIIMYIVLGFQGGIQAGKLKEVNKAINFFSLGYNYRSV